MVPVQYLLLFLPMLVLANSNGHCVMRGNCGRDDLTYLNRPCVYNGAPVPLTDLSAINILNDLCPDLGKGPGTDVCCDADQLNAFNDQMQALGALFKRCPSCYLNLANIFCQQLCSPNQSLFMEVTASTNNSVDGIDYYNTESYTTGLFDSCKNVTSSTNNSVDGIDYYITESYTTGLFDSCKNVKLAETTSRAIEISCGAHSADCTPHLWLEYMGGHDPAPYQINFHFEKTNNVTVKGKMFYPMNEKIIPCSEAVSEFSTPCSYVDCPRSATPSPRPPTSSPPPFSTPPPPDKKFLGLPLLVGVLALACVVIVVIAVIIISGFACRKC